MDKTFNFRVWCVNKKQWETGKVYIDNKGFVFDDFHRVKEETHIVNFCTGLKDRNGKDIYEGDIVKLTKNDNPNMNNILGVVKYSKEYAMFFINIPNNIAWYEFCEVEKKGLTIIGNIYENRKLLEDKCKKR